MKSQVIYGCLILCSICYLCFLYGQRSSSIVLSTIKRDQSGYRIVNKNALESSTVLEQTFQDLVDRRVQPDDPSLIQVIRAMLDPPSKALLKRSREMVLTPQAEAINEVLKGKENGFFIEAGGYDGETSSNSLWFEQKKGWTGLLVEPDPYFYTQILGKARKSWSINACLSLEPHPTIMNFKESEWQIGEVQDELTPQSERNGFIRKVPCVPLQSILLALNRSVVDFFSLDVEGFEVPILKSVPWDRVLIKSLAVEYKKGRATKEEYRAYVEGKGYEVYKDIIIRNPDEALYVTDFIFVKR